MAAACFMEQSDLARGLKRTGAPFQNGKAREQSGYVSIQHKCGGKLSQIHGIKQRKGPSYLGSGF